MGVLRFQSPHCCSLPDPSLLSAGWGQGVLTAPRSLGAGVLGRHLWQARGTLSAEHLSHCGGNPCTSLGHGAIGWTWGLAPASPAPGAC